MSDIRDATHVKIDGTWERIVSKWGIDAEGHLAKPSQGGFGCVTESGRRVGMMEAERYDARPCGHVPARPDVDLTLCWICGVQIIADPERHLWRPLTETEALVRYETIRQLRQLFFSVHPAEFGLILRERMEIKGKPAIRLATSVMGRWIIVNGQSEDLAWSGSRWVPHQKGLSVPGPDGLAVQICNFDTREEAEAYAEAHFPQEREQG